MSIPIPTPPSVPFLGHVTSIDKEVPLLSINLLAKQYGEIYQLNMLGEWTAALSRVLLTPSLAREKDRRYILAQAPSRNLR